MMNLFRKLSTLGVVAAAVSASAQSWDLEGNWAPPANPNGTWQYGQMTGGVLFTALPWDPTTTSYGIGTAGNVFDYMNTSGSLAYGIQPGDVSLEADWGDAAVQWTAPTAGGYKFNIDLGGTLQNAGGGYGNNFSVYGQVAVNGTPVGMNTFTNNTKAWTFSQYLAAGSTVDAYVLNPGFANGGNTDTLFTVSAVPEPAPFGVLAVGGLAFLRRRRRN